MECFQISLTFNDAVDYVWLSSLHDYQKLHEMAKNTHSFSEK